MKILATKKEMGNLVRSCATGGLCSSCALGNFCCNDSTELKIEDFIEVVEDADEEQK